MLQLFVSFDRRALRSSSQGAHEVESLLDLRFVIKYTQGSSFKASPEGSLDHAFELLQIQSPILIDISSSEIFLILLLVVGCHLWITLCLFLLDILNRVLFD